MVGEGQRHEHRGLRYERGSPEFARVAGLSDAVFAIAMTLLVLTLDMPDVRADVADALVAQLPQLLAFLISFAVIANFWWIHHRLLAVLDRIDGGLLALNLALLGAVALVPYPTGLLGLGPTERVIVVPYLALIGLIGLLHVAMLVRTHVAGAWREQPSPGLFRWLLAGWASSAAVPIVAIPVALWHPVAGLVVLAATWPVEGLVQWRAPDDYARWG